MHTSSTILPQNAPSGVYHLDEKSGWIARISQKVAAFYAYGFLYKWLRSFRNPEVLVISDEVLDPNPWKKTFKTSNVTCITTAEALELTTHPQNPANLLVVFQYEGTSESVLQFSPLLKHNGAFLWFTQNRHQTWPQIQADFERQNITDMFALGFHPQGAVAWWPFESPVAVFFGKLVDFIATFFLYKSGTARRFGQLWMIRGIKYENDTQLS